MSIEDSIKEPMRPRSRHRGVRVVQKQGGSGKNKPTGVSSVRRTVVRRHHSKRPMIH